MSRHPRDVGRRGADDEYEGGLAEEDADGTGRIQDPSAGRLVRLRGHTIPTGQDLQDLYYSLNTEEFLTEGLD